LIAALGLTVELGTGEEIGKRERGKDGLSSFRYQFAVAAFGVSIRD